MLLIVSPALHLLKPVSLAALQIFLLSGCQALNSTLADSCNNLLRLLFVVPGHCLRGLETSYKAIPKGLLREVPLGHF